MNDGNSVECKFSGAGAGAAGACIYFLSGAWWRRGARWRRQKCHASASQAYAHRIPFVDVNVI